MYTAFIAIQYIGIVILVFEILYLFTQKPSRLSMILLVVFFSVLINFVGYLFELKADTRDMALQCVKMIYIGKPFIILGTVLFVLEFFRIKYTRIIKYILCLFHIMITVLVLTCEYHNLFYNRIEYVNTGFFPHLVFGHGIFYDLFTMSMIVYMVLLIVIVINKYISAKTKKEKRQIFYIGTIPAVSGICLLVFISGITGGYDSTLPSYLYAAVILMILMIKYNLLDTMEVAKENLIDEFADGLLVFDTDGQLIYMNSRARLIYPALNEKNLEKYLSELKHSAQKEKRKFAGGKVYRINEKEIELNGTLKGFMYVVSDVTEIHNCTVELERLKHSLAQEKKAES